MEIVYNPPPGHAEYSVHNCYKYMTEKRMSLGTSNPFIEISRRIFLCNFILSLLYTRYG